MTTASFQLRCPYVADLAALAGPTHPQHPLTLYHQWVLWTSVQKPGKSKPDKVPCDVDGKAVNAHQAQNWMSFHDALACVQANLCDGIGFVLTEDDPFFCVDQDHLSRRPDRGLDIADTLPGCALETSHGGDGRHVWGSFFGELPPHKKRDNVHGLECYTADRFIAVTGIDARGSAATDATPHLCRFLERYLAQSAPAAAHLPEVRSDVDEAADGNVVATLCASNPTFARVWAGELDAAGAALGSDRSAIDYWMACRIVEQVGRDPERVARILLLCEGMRREKWERADYLMRTARSAIAQADAETRLAGVSFTLPVGALPLPPPDAGYEAHKQHQRETNARIAEEALAFVTDGLSLDGMCERFVWIAHGSAVGDSTRHTVRTFADAAAEYAASKTRIAGTEGRRDKDVPTIKLWRDSPGARRKTADMVTWWPGEGVLCRAPTGSSAGERAFNTYRPMRVLTPPTNWQEMAAMFVAHVEYLVPIEVERRLFLQWLAHAFQRPEILPHIYFVMIALSTGTGRGWLGSVLTRCLRGLCAPSVNISQILESGFNGALAGKLFAYVDEVREGNSTDRYKKGERLKSMVTEEVRHINPKYGVQSVEKNCLRWLMFSNHLDALPFENNDRRAVIIRNPDAPRTAAYYTQLYAALDRPDFIASVQHYLLTLDLAAFNPGARAPMNVAKREALGSMETTADKDARAFAEQWPGVLAAVSDLRDAMGGDAPNNPTAMGHVIRRAGMVTADKKVRVDPAPASPQTILIVRPGTLRPDEVDTLPPDAVRLLIKAARTDYAKAVIM